MRPIGAYWQQLPVVVRATLTGVVAATAGTVPWALLASANLKHGSSVPWAVPPTALYLWFYWRYARGAGWPASTAEARRTNSRANRLPDEIWGAALLAGVLGLGSVLAVQNVTSRLVTLPVQRDIDPTRYPFVTVLLWILMSAVVAGVAEEVSFRGFLQRPIERRHGPVAAVLITGLLFGLAHFTHPEVTVVLLLYYLTVAAVYGALAYLTDSILPSLILHAGGNILSAFDLFTRGRSEWQAAAQPLPLVWETGPDTSFWMSLVLLAFVGGATVWAFALLAQAAREGRGRGD